MNNVINIHGLIAPADLAWMRDFFGDCCATFPQDVEAALASASTAEDITLRIDSPGGYCDAGNAMIIALRDWSRVHNRQVHVEVGAQAASMAACMMFSFNGTIKAHRNSLVMLHGARCSVFSDTIVADELRDTADALDVINDIIIDTVAERTGRDREEIASWIKGTKETFFGARKLLEYDLIDGVIDASPSIAKAVSATALSHVSRLTACRRDGGFLAAVACASIDLEKVKMPETINEEEAIETPVAEAVEESTAEAEAAPETSEAPVAADEEKPEEEKPAEEESPAEEEEKPAEEEEKPEEEATASLADTVAQAVAEAVSALKAENDALRAQLADLTVRAEKAEGIAQGLKVASVQAALIPPAKDAVPSGRQAIMAEWYAAVKAHGYDGARQKCPDLFNAAKTACAK